MIIMGVGARRTKHAHPKHGRVWGELKRKLPCDKNNISIEYIRCSESGDLPSLQSKGCVIFDKQSWGEIKSAPVHSLTYLYDNPKQGLFLLRVRALQMLSTYLQLRRLQPATRAYGSCSPEYSEGIIQITLNRIARIARKGNVRKTERSSVWMQSATSLLPDDTV